MTLRFAHIGSATSDRGPTVTANLPGRDAPEVASWNITAIGFAQTPSVPRELGRADMPGLELDPSQLSFFVGRANVKSTLRPGMARWRERLYSGLARIATGRLISSASRRTGSSNSAPRSRYEGFDHSEAWSAGRVSSLQSAGLFENRLGSRDRPVGDRGFASLLLRRRMSERSCSLGSLMPWRQLLVDSPTPSRRCRNVDEDDF
jgi:hypothetical protein